MQRKIGHPTLIRRMEEQDLDVVYQIENQVAMDPWDKQLFISCSIIYDSFVITIDNGSVIGFGIIAVYNSINEAHILNLAVAKEFHSFGIGSQLLSYLINLCVGIDQQISYKIFLEVNKDNQAAISLYKKFKFKEVGIRKNYYNTKNGKEDALIFLLNII